ncbi:MAG TPA: hypothetical protein ENF94_01715 [Candidatus Woesearchaeota archaeon]|nr:MAG: hypothetical protein DRJ25_05900 [Candidatus Woesearchaeota archaeon]HDD70858.1 hypothetical protein [Candidatus Woesearchaeota archaeon]
MVEIIFLGTGSSLDNLTRRNAGGFVLKTESEQIHFDPGPGAVAAAQAFNVNLKNTDAVIISRNDSIRNNEQNLISQLSDKQTLMINQESKRLNKIGTTKTERTDYGYKIIAKNFTLLYLFKPLTKETIKKDKLNADVLILNNKYLNKGKEEIGTDDSYKIIQEIRPKLAILTGFSSNFKGDKHIQTARDLQKRTGVQVVAADDGTRIDLVSYAALAAQRRIFSFTK